MACSFHHEEECSSNKSRIRILKDNQWALIIPPVHSLHSSPCVESCPPGAISRDEATGAVSVDAEACVGCENCISACPIRALALDEEKGIAFKCDLCGGDPECVKWCLMEHLPEGS